MSSQRKAAEQLGEQFARLGTVTPEPSPARESRMPAEQPKPATWDARISLTTSAEMKRELDIARADDGIEATARIRAMITLWQQDDRLRARVNKLAKTLR